MVDVTLPGAVYNQNPTGSPLEAEPVSTLTGLEAQFGASMRSTLGVSLETQALGAFRSEGDMVPYDTIKGVFDGQKLDASVFPKGQPVRRGEVLAIMGQQLAIQKDQDLADRAHLGAYVGGAAGFVGGLSDPTVLGGGLIAGPLLGAARAGLGVTEATALSKGAPLAARALTGATEGGVGVAGYEKAQQQYGSAQGDRDITTGQIVHDAMWGSIIGGGLKGALGVRPTRVDLEPLREMVVGAENSAGYAKARSIPVDQVVSNKGAVGLHQITPDTAKSLGYDPEILKTAAGNEEVANANLEKLYRRFGNDPEAIAVAWNAGPGTAAKFIKAGRDRSILPKETQDYLARIDKMNGTGGVAAPASTPPVVTTAARDSGLVVARKMPDGSVMYGEKGDVHFNLLSDDEFNGHTEMPDPNSMGFAEPGGPWMSRQEAAASLGQTGKLEADAYQRAQAGLPPNPTEFGRRGIPDATDIAVAKTAIAQAEAGSEINVEPVIKAMNDEKNGKSFKTNPFAIRDEHEREVTGLESQAFRNIELARAIPERNSAATNPIKDKLEAINKTVKEAKPERTTGPTGRDPHPQIAELQRQAKEATEEAANLHAGLTGEAAGAEGNRFETYMKASEEAFDKSEGAEAQPEFQKALEAAVQCGLKNGEE